MKPGRELDALVAEKVMGYRRKRCDCNTFWVDADGYEPTHNQDYSTDIAAAWEVVERVRLFVWPHQGRWIAGYLSEADLQDIYFHVENSRFITIDGSFSTIAQEQTAPHAICLAALKAVGL